MSLFAHTSFSSANNNNYLEKINSKDINNVKEFQNSNLTNNQKLQKDSYIVGPGDILEIRFIDLPELSGTINILNDGTGSIPLLGTHFLSNLTINQAKNKIFTLLEKELIVPNIQLSIFQPRPIRVSVVGEVERPGLYSMTTQEFNATRGDEILRTNGLPTVFDAIRKSGGITNQSDLNKVILKRRLPGQQGGFKMTHLNFLSLIREGDQSQNPYLFDGDIILVNKSKNIQKNAIETAAANLSPKLINVYVIGEVKNPGLQQIMANTPISQAIMNAGGTLFLRSNQSHIQLVRLQRNGTVLKKNYKLDLSLGPSSKNPPLKSGDIINVRSNSFAKTSDGLSIISKPFTGMLNIYSFLRIIGD